MHVLYETDRIKIHNLYKRKFMENIKMLVRTENVRIFFTKRKFIEFADFQMCASTFINP